MSFSLGASHGSKPYTSSHHDGEYDGKSRTSSVDASGDFGAARERLTYSDNMFNNLNKKLKPPHLVASRLLERAKNKKQDATGDLRELCIRIGDTDILNGTFFQSLLDVQNIKDKDKDWDRKYLRYVHYYIRALTSVDGDIEGRLVKQWRPMSMMINTVTDQHRRHSRSGSTSSTGSNHSVTGGPSFALNINNVNSDSVEGIWRVRGITSQQLVMAIEMFGRPGEAMHSHLPRRMATYKTVAKLAAEAHASALVLASTGSNPDEARLLRRAVLKAREVLKAPLDELSALAAPENDKKAKKVKKKEEEYQRKLHESVAVLSALRHCPPLRDDVSYLPNILQGCTSQNHIAARHAFALLLDQAKLNPATILRALAEKNWLQPTHTGLQRANGTNSDDYSGGDGLNLIDELGCVYYLRTLQVVVFAEVSYWDESKRLACYMALSNSVKEERRSRVALEAIQCMMGHERAWKLLLEAEESCLENEKASGGGGSSSTSGGGGRTIGPTGILQRVVSRLEDCLGEAVAAGGKGMANWPLAHATCRVCREVGKVYQLSQSHESGGRHGKKKGTPGTSTAIDASNGGSGGSGGAFPHVVTFSSNPGVANKEAAPGNQQPFDLFSDSPRAGGANKSPCPPPSIDILLDLPPTPTANGGAGSNGFGAVKIVTTGPQRSLEDRNIMCIKDLCLVLRGLGLLDSSQTHVRAMALEAAFLLLPGSSQLRDDTELSDLWAWLQFKIELCPITLPEHLLEGVVQSLLTRVECSAASRKESMTVTLDILEAFMYQRPKHSMARTLLHAWVKCLQFDDACRQLVLASVFSILDSSFPLPPPECPEALQLSVASHLLAPSSASTLGPAPTPSLLTLLSASSSTTSTSLPPLPPASNTTLRAHRKTGTSTTGSVLPSNLSSLASLSGLGSSSGGSSSSSSSGGGGGGDDGGGRGSVGLKKMGGIKSKSSSTSGLSSQLSLSSNSNSTSTSTSVTPTTSSTSASSLFSSITGASAGVQISSIGGGSGSGCVPAGAPTPEHKRGRSSFMHGRRDSGASTSNLTIGSPGMMGGGGSGGEEYDLHDHGLLQLDDEEAEGVLMTYWRERQASMQLKRMAYWLLGEYCCELTGYAGTDPGLQKRHGARRGSAANAPRKFSAATREQHLIMLASHEFTSPILSQATSSSSSSSSSCQHVVLTSVNDATISMLLRLKQAALFEDSDTRKAAIISLCEIALRLPDPIKFDVYVFLVQLHDVDRANHEATIATTSTSTSTSSHGGSMGPLEQYVKKQVVHVEAFSHGESCGLGGIIGPVVNYLDLFYERMATTASSNATAINEGVVAAEEAVRAVLLGC